VRPVGLVYGKHASRWRKLYPGAVSERLPVRSWTLGGFPRAARDGRIPSNSSKASSSSYIRSRRPFTALSADQ